MVFEINKVEKFWVKIDWICCLQKTASLITIFAFYECPDRPKIVIIEV